MIHLFINGSAASAGGGLTYIRNVIPHLGARTDVRAAVLVSAELRAELGNWPNIEFLDAPALPGAWSRFRFEQAALPGLIRKSGAHVLLSTGNFALWNSPVPQILLSRNALYTSTDFVKDLRRRGDYRLWFDTEAKAVLAKGSIRRADVTVAPSAAFAEELRHWAGKDVLAIHHGFDFEAFTADMTPLPEETRKKLDSTPGSLKLLFVSHYNYYRNFETLIRALPLLREMLAPRKVQLVLTCKLRSDANPGSYNANNAAQLVQELGVSESVIELGSVPYRQLHHVYRACEIYVTPAYAESFAHPLVEAMSIGIPIVASRIAVHGEICGDAATYFDRFCPRDLAQKILDVASCTSVVQSMSQAGKNRSEDFSWGEHVGKITRAIRQELL